jgi:chemotaxis protein MotB
MPGDKLARVVGLAASELLDKAVPTAPINRRISITVMTREAENRLLGARGATDVPGLPPGAANPASGAVSEPPMAPRPNQRPDIIGLQPHS